MAKKRVSRPKQSSPVKGSSNDQVEPDKKPDGSIREGSCGVRLWNFYNAVKHSMRYYTSTIYQCISPAFSSRRLVDNKQTPRVSPAKESSLQQSSSGISWRLLIILNVLTTSLIFHHFYKDPVELPELRVMMLGETGAGKSASGNTILGREAFKSKASAIPVTKSCDSQSGVVEGQNITVIDTPAITTREAAWLSEKVDPGPHVFLLVIPLGRFTEEDGEEVKWIQRNFGEGALNFTIVLFTGGDQVDEINAEEFLNECSRLQTLVRSTGGGYHIFDNKTPRGRGQVKGLLKKIELLLRKNTGYSYSYGLHEQVKTAVMEEEEMKRREEERERRDEERKRREEEREEEERKRREEEMKRRGEERKRRGNEEERKMERRGNEEERKRREDERGRRQEERERTEEERKRRRNKIREEEEEKERKTREEEEEEERKRIKNEEERKGREEERKRRGEERERREEERRKEKRREERTTEQSWNFGNILYGFIGFVLRVIMEKIWFF